jgi:hypothetical protein
MADEIPEQKRPEEESKKDTVRINLPPGLTGRGTPGPGGAPSPMAKPKVPGSPGSPEDEAKRETSVMSRPTEAPKPKKDTSRVQVVAAKPITADGTRPPVKLVRDEPAAAPEAATAATTAKGAKPAPRPAAVGAPSGAEAGLSIFAMILSLAVAGFLAYIAFG